MRESYSTSDQSSSESFEALPDQMSSKVVRSWVRLVVEVGSDVELEPPPAVNAGRHSLSECAACATSFLFNLIISEAGDVSKRVFIWRFVKLFKLIV
jgi:hypothetical protein